MTRSGEAAAIDDGATAEQVEAVLGVLDGTLPAGTLVALSVYGSAVVGGLRPDSDLDLFGLLGRSLTDDERQAVVHGIVPLSWRMERPAGWRPIELSLVVHEEIRPWRYPPRLEFQYGEWRRESLIAGDLGGWPVEDPDLAVLVTMVRSRAVAVRGPHPAALLDPVPSGDLERAILDALPSLIAEVEPDTRNVLLTLARMWLTVATGEIASKTAAAAWASKQLPAPTAALLERARAGYLGRVEDRWDDIGEARQAAHEVAERIRRGALAR